MSAHDDLAGYVLNALDDTERAAFEQHLSTCAACSAEVAELSEVTAELGAYEIGGYADDVDDVEGIAVDGPPPGLRAQVLQAIAQVPQLPPIQDSPAAPVGFTAQPVPAEAVVPQAVASAPSAGAGPVEPPHGVDELAARRGRRANRASWVVAAAMAIVVGASGWIYAAGQRRDAEIAGQQLTNAQQSMDAQREAQARFWSAADLKTYSASLSNGASATFAVSRSENKALFVSGDLPSPGPGKTYQLWTIRSATDIRPDVLVDGGGPVSSFLTGDVDGVATLAMTIEPEGGSQTPTLPIQAAANI